MATPISLFVLLLLLCSSSIVAQSDQHVRFSYNGFNESNLKRVGATVLSGALRLTDKTQKVIGHAFYPHPIRFHLNTSSSNPNKNISSFSTHFVFQIVPSGSNPGGHGLAFTVSPAMEFPGAEAGHYLGILSRANDNKSSNHLFAVEFDTVSGFNDTFEGEKNHVGVNINSMRSVDRQLASYYVDGSDLPEVMKLEDGDPIQAWVDYDGSNRVLNVTIAPILKLDKPTRPLITKVIDLSPVLLDDMYVGFSAATGEKSSAHYILGWSFGLNGTAPPLNLLKLPVVPVEKKSPKFKPEIKAMIGALSGMVVILVAALLIVMAYRRRLNFESLEEWELDCPHRFKYKDLHVATKGFKESELLGTGGFGAVYKGALPTTGEEIAVKKIMSNNSVQGMREFAAEIECLGRLRHKNLVNLQGWGPIVDDPERGRVILVNWVIERLQAETGGMVDVVDPNLGPGYVVEEMELVLGLGLLCSNPKAEARPSMREILRYLNGDDLLPGIDKLGSAIGARQVQETMARFFISSDGATTSSSIGQMSSSSFEAGR
ncbi:hypothetical protein RHGRI_015560 [Rhododendron griersonianum]|uniref:Protein kinase domain-containing protein n=1 Tax=Rhododendron griersonianum TaxID=479676 RepID=A0AAV6KEB3_9ERIC|nr:hypothetical protein RHGRI_015560 [Rhododendron griersonianum]